MSTVYAGVDVGKDNLVLSVENHLSEWPNTTTGIRRLIRKLATEPAAQVVCESTGGYEAALVAACHLAEIPVSVVFPARVRNYARSCAQWAKTDAIDAAIIAAFARATQPKAEQPKTVKQRQLAELVKNREQLMKQMAMRRQQVKDISIAKLRQQAEHSLRILQKELQLIDEMLAEMAADDEFRDRIAQLTSVSGIGTVSALAILAYLPEIGRVNRREVAGLAGVAPFNRDSGRKTGKRSIFGGRAPLRNALYMPALVACRHHPTLKLAYQKMLANGKAKKVAITAIMRRLLVILNAIIKQSLKDVATA